MLTKEYLLWLNKHNNLPRDVEFYDTSRDLAFCHGRASRNQPEIQQDWLTNSQSGDTQYKIMQSWSSLGQLACLTKCWLATSADMFEDLLREMRDVCQKGPWVTLFNSFRKSLFSFPNLAGRDGDPTCTRFRAEIMKEDVMDRLYTEVIAAFEFAIEALEKDG